MADNVVLLSEIPMALPLVHVQVLDRHDWLCRLSYYIRYTGRIWSACLTLVVTIERYLFVAHPLQKTYFQKYHFYRIFIPLTLTISAACATYALFLIKVQVQAGRGKMCSILRGKRKLFMIVDLVIVRGIGDLIIGAFIMLFTILCVKVLHKARRLRNQSLRELTPLNSSSGNQSNRVPRSGSRESKITKMLLLLAIMFILFKVPYTVFYYCTLHWNVGKGLSPIEAVIMNAKHISEALSLISYAFNFFVYVMLIPSFRANLAFVFRSQCFK